MENIKLLNGDSIHPTCHSGKMAGIPSISTDKFLNPNCKKMMELSKYNLNMICGYCYVDSVFNYRPSTQQAIACNTKVLPTRVLTKEELKLIAKSFANTVIARFESFGDLINETHLINYINIAKACKYTKFALFTKHYRIIKEYFKKGLKMPKNITLVLSAPFMDKDLNELFVNGIKKYHSRTITFMVTKDKNSPSINCGKRKCLECRNCYDAKKPHNVIELVK